MKFLSVMRRKALFIPVVLIAFFYLFAWAGLPNLLRWQAEKQVRERSGHVLFMNTPEINPFTLTARITNLGLNSPEGEKLVAFEHLVVDLSGKDLFTGLIALDQVDLKNLRLNVALLPNGKNNFTALLEAFKDTDPDDENTEPPALLLKHLRVGNAAIDFHDQRKPDGLKTRFEPLNLELRDLATRSEKNGDFVLDAMTGLDASLKLRAQIQLANPSVVGELKLTGLNIAKLEPLLKPWLPTAPPSGAINLAMNFDINLQENTAQPKVVISNLNAEVREFNIAAQVAGAAPVAQFSKLNLSGGLFDLQANKAALGNVVLTGLQLKHGDQPAAIALDALEIDSVTADLAQHNARVGAARIKGGQINVKRNTRGEINLINTLNAWANGAKPAEKTAEKAPTQPWRYAIDEVSVLGINASFQDQTLNPALHINLNQIEMASSGISQDLNQPLPLRATLNVEKGGSVALSGQVTPATAAMQLNVEVKALALKPVQPFIGKLTKLDLASGTLSGAGKLTYNAEQQDYLGSVQVANLRLNETGTQRSFLKFKQLFTPHLAINAKGLNMRNLTLVGLDTALLIAKDKTTNLSRILVSHVPNTAPATGTAPVNTSLRSEPAFQVNIERFKVSESEMDFADESLFIPFGTRIHNLEGVITGLSNKPNTRGELALKGIVDEYGEARAQGTLNLLNPTAFMNIAVKFNQVEMSSLTPYSGTFANRKIQSGKLSLNLKYQIENQQLNSSNQVVIDKLTLGERVQSPQGRDLPLELAIALLEDSNGRIELGLPIKGNLSDPEFSYGAIVWKAIGNVLTKIVTAPFRALSALLGGKEENLDQVVFEAGSNTLSPSQKEALKKLAQALNARNNIALTIQGTWAAVDKSALQDLQLRRAVLLQAGEKLLPNEDPGPLALSSAIIQKSIETLFEKRLGAKALRDAKQNTVNGKNLHSVLIEALQNTEEVTQAQLQTLATERQDQVRTELASTGVSLERMKTGAPKEVPTEVPTEKQDQEDQTVPMELSITVNQ